jgi:hypothetical protein
VPRGGELKALINGYLDIEHSEDVAGGCPVAALATEIARRPPKTRAALLRLLAQNMAQVAKFIPGANEEERERNSWQRLQEPDSIVIDNAEGRCIHETSDAMIASQEAVTS